MKVKKETSGIPRTVVIIAVIVAFIGLGPKGVRYILHYSAAKQQSGAITPSGETMKPGITLSSNSAQLGGSFSDYQMVVENSLFRPLGWQKTVEIPSLPEPVVQRERPYERPKPPNHLILTGITYLAHEPMSLIEDISRGEAYFLRAGDKLKNHVVEAITEENIILVNGNSRITAALGTKTYYDAVGELLAAGLAESQTTGSIMENSNEEPAPLGEGTADLSIIERMRARRKRELEQE